MKKKKLLYIASHLSTGGMPQYILKQVETFIGEYDIQVVEWADHSPIYVVQKNKLKDLVVVHTLRQNKKDIFEIIKSERPDIIHFTEIPEHFISHDILDKIFDNKKRKYDIVCSTHGSFTNPDEIKYQPDRYVLVSEWSRRRFEHLGVDTKVWEYPIEDIKYDKDKAKEELGFEKDWKHVLMVGLFTPGKNQGEIFNVASMLEKYKIKFHFVGNQAPNFQNYWLPIMKTKPDNCIIWGERSDTDKFYKASDMFYFSSKLELNPLSIKEALSYGLPCIFRRLHTYLDTYDENPLVRYINDNLSETKRVIIEKLNPQFNDIPGWFSFQPLYDNVIENIPHGGRIVEVGSWMGKSTNHMAKLIRESGKNVDFTTIDTFKGNQNESLQQSIVNLFDNDLFFDFVDNTIQSDNIDYVNVIKDTSQNASNHFINNSIDFAFIDAEYDYDEVKKYLKTWMYKVKPGGYIGGDDYGVFDDVTRAVDDYFYNQITRGTTFFYRRKPRIQIFHLMTKPNDLREQVSMKSLKQLQRYGFDYTPIVNTPYTDLPPVEFCRRPEHISKDNTPGELYPGAGLGWITGGHYGCYMAHRGALESMSDGYDYTLIFEADAFIYTGLEEFVDIVYKACFISERDDVPYISFADNPPVNGKTKIDELFSQTPHNQDLAHAYLVRNQDKQWWMDRINDCEWDVADLWYNHVFYHHPRKRYTTNKVYSKQAEGYSLLDQHNKTWK